MSGLLSNLNSSCEGPSPLSRTITCLLTSANMSATAFKVVPFRSLLLPANPTTHLQLCFSKFGKSRLAAGCWRDKMTCCRPSFSGIEPCCCSISSSNLSSAQSAEGRSRGERAPKVSCLVILEFGDALTPADKKRTLKLKVIRYHQVESTHHGWPLL